MRLNLILLAGALALSGLVGTASADTNTCDTTTAMPGTCVATRSSEDGAGSCDDPDGSYERHHVVDVRVAGEGDDATRLRITSGCEATSESGGTSSSYLGLAYDDGEGRHARVGWFGIERHSSEGARQDCRLVVEAEGLPLGATLYRGEHCPPAAQPPVVPPLLP